MVKVIGRGSFAKVYLVKKYNDDNSFNFYALKVLKKTFIYEKKQMRNTLQERKVLLEVKHPFIVEMHYAF